MNKKEEVIAVQEAGDYKPGIMAVLSLISGIFSIMFNCIPVAGAFLGFILGTGAIVLGTIEIKKINKDTAGEKGRGMPIAGIILGTLGILIGIFWLIIITIMWFTGTFGNILNI